MLEEKNTSVLLKDKELIKLEEDFKKLEQGLKVYNLLMKGKRILIEY